jgi:nucleotide-binding universal stress UspA family protein
MKILLAVDGSPYSKKMLAYLATHDTLLNSENTYTLFTALMALPPLARAAVGKEAVEEYYTEETEKVFAALSKYLVRHGIDAKTERKVGPAGPAIAKCATDGKYDLVVMGSHGHGAVLNLVMGSVANQVLAHCKVPVLLVR